MMPYVPASASVAIVRAPDLISRGRTPSINGGACAVRCMLLLGVFATDLVPWKVMHGLA